MTQREFIQTEIEPRRKELYGRFSELVSKYPPKGDSVKVTVSRELLEKVPSLTPYVEVEDNKPFYLKDGFKRQLSAGLASAAAVVYPISKTGGVVLIALSGVIGGIGIIHGEVKANKQKESSYIVVLGQILKLILELIVKLVVMKTKRRR